MGKTAVAIPKHAGYYLQMVKCQKACCQAGATHGPYVYAQWWTGQGRHRTAYLRKATPDDQVHIKEAPLTAADVARRRRKRAPKAKRR